MKTQVRVNEGTVYGITNTMMECPENNQATSFITENYENLKLAARKMGVDPSMCGDIVNDVFISIYKNELNGEGYDPNKGRMGPYITVEEFVYGRLKAYSHNKKYKLLTDEVIRSHNRKSLMEIPACAMTDDVESMTFYQQAYDSAANYDDLEAVELELSVAEELEYCLTFSSELKMNLRYFLKNLTSIANMKIDVSVFKELGKLATNSEFLESLMSVTTYAKEHPERYSDLIAAI